MHGSRPFGTVVVQDGHADQAKDQQNENGREGRAFLRGQMQGHARSVATVGVLASGLCGEGCVTRAQL